MCRFANARLALSPVGVSSQGAPLGGPLFPDWGLLFPDWCVFVSRLNIFLSRLAYPCFPAGSGRRFPFEGECVFRMGDATVPDSIDTRNSTY
jgi:hypothetical protein